MAIDPVESAVPVDAFVFLERLGYRISDDGDGPDAFMVRDPDSERYFEMDVRGIEDEARELGWDDPNEPEPDPETDAIIRAFLAPLYPELGKSAGSQTGERAE